LLSSTLAEILPGVRVALVNQKGGVGKSTSAVYLAAGLARHGRTLLVDADPQGTVLTWSELAGDNFGPVVVSLPTRDLRRRLAELAKDYEHVMIDCPPANPAISRSAALAADVVVIPTSPTLVDLDRLRPTLELLAEVEEQQPFEVRVLLTRVRAGTVSGRAAREFLTDEAELPLFEAAITLREFYGAAFGLVIENLGEYADVLQELLVIEAQAGVRT
jgi:chromosome partitioning protein